MYIKSIYRYNASQTLLKDETDIVLFVDRSYFNVYKLLRERELDRNN